MSSNRVLIEKLQACAERAKHAELSLGEVLDSVQEAAYSFTCIVLSLPFLQPVSLGPLGTVGGLTFAALGWQLFRGHPAPLLPVRVRQTVIGKKTWEMMIGVCVKILRWCGTFTKPRLSAWVSGRKGQKVCGLTIIAGGLLMAIPFFGLPMNNLLPALAIFFVCVAELEQDGIMVFIAFGWLAVTVIYFTVIIIIVAMLGTQAIDWLR
ncbi:MAG: exopolysaccharide biosynthesis protein [Gammaproteobacteria bacterium]